MLARWQHLVPAAIGFGLLGIAVTFSLLTLSRLEVDNAAVRHTFEVKTRLSRVLSLLQGAETGQRGFLLTGDERYLRPYEQRDLIPYEFRALEGGVPDLAMSSDLTSLRTLIEGKLNELARTIERRRRGDPAGALAIVRTDEGQVLMNRIREVIADIGAAQDRALSEHEQETRQSSRVLQAGLLVTILMIAALAFVTVKQTSRKARLLVAATSAAWASQSRYRLLADHGSDVIVLKSAVTGGPAAYVSPAVRSVLGYEPDEFVRLGRRTLIHPDDYREVLHLYASLGETMPTATSIHRLRHKDGHWVWDEIAYTVTQHRPDADQAEVPVVIMAIRDASQRQAKDAELRAAKEAAEAAARAKGDFLASMSHELRTPLNAIIGFTGIMLDSGELSTPAMRRYAHLVQEASATLLAVVNDVLDVSKLEAGNLELDPRPFSPRHLAEGTAELMRTQAEAKQLTLQVALDAELPPRLFGDDARLRQILINLLSNAVKFTARGGVMLEVRTTTLADGRAGIRFTVSDTGIGIPHTKRHRLFKRFSQVDSSTARQFGGTGLGLSICKNLVELMGGTIQVESEEGTGSTFSFELDLPVAESHAAVEVGPETGADCLTGQGLMILLAEDVAMNRELAVALLTRWGHRVDAAEDGATAVDAVRRHDYDLVLMDVQMPVMGGVEATGRIRGFGGRYSTLPIIAMTANVLAEDVARFLASGMSDHIGKPFAPEKLRAVVERWRPERLASGGSSERGAAPVAAQPAVPVLDRGVFDEFCTLVDTARISALLRSFLSLCFGVQL